MSPPKTPEDLSVDQREVYNAIVRWSAGRDGFRDTLLKVGGLAGTGKTSLLSVLAHESRSGLVAYVAFTGRAASNLARKFAALGVRSTSKTMLPEGQELRSNSRIAYEADSPEARLPFVGTIHRLLYRPIIDPKTEELRGWAKREELDRPYDLLVVDEASMVGDDILEDLRRHGAPILAVGDHGQLPPVKSAGGLMREPDLRLEKIHRQAAQSPIIQLAHCIRNGEGLRSFKGWDQHVQLAQRSEVDRAIEETYKRAESFGDVAVICWTNRMRIKLNTACRRILGVKGEPRKDEQIICLKNSPPIFNGMRGILQSDSRPGSKPWNMLLHASFPDEEVYDQHLFCNAAQFNRDRPFQSVEELQAIGIEVETMSAAGSLYDFGYCLTAHKSQGGGFKEVVVYLDRTEETGNEDYRRWMYTACTRAVERLTVLR
jgi:exodeoxyribonuclease-5